MNQSISMLSMLFVENDTFYWNKSVTIWCMYIIKKGCVWLTGTDGLILSVPGFYLGKNHISWKWNPTRCPATGAAIFGVWPITRKLISRKLSQSCGQCYCKKGCCDKCHYPLQNGRNAWFFKIQVQTGQKKSAASSCSSK